MSTVIIGAGESSRVAEPGRTAMSFAVEAALAAIDDAGLSPKDIDGIVSGNSLTEPRLDYSADLAEELGITPHWSRTESRLGATGAAVVVGAVAAVEAGLCDRALVVWGDNRVSTKATDVAGLLATNLNQFETIAGPLVATQYALVARAYLERWGADPEDLASVAVQFRKHAGLNDRARYRDPITVEDVLSSPMASSPLHRLECALVTDYGGAVVVAREDRAPDDGNAVKVLGMGEAMSHWSILRNPGLFADGSSAGAISSRRAYEAAGMVPSDLEMAQVYDCFTITVLTLLEDFGLAGRGESGAAMRAGEFDRSAGLPLNTNGGMLSCGSGGILHVTEAVRQMRGNAGSHQLDQRPGTGLVHGNGGVLGTHTTILLGQK